MSKSQENNDLSAIKNSQELAGSDRKVFGWQAMLILITAVLLSMYHLYAAGFGFFPGIGTRSHMFVHLSLGLVLAFLIFPIKKNMGQRRIAWYDFIFAAMSLGIGIYLHINQDSTSILRGIITQTDEILGLILILLILEATRRVVGKPLVIIALCFIVYFFFGDFFPEPFTHTRTGVEDFVYEMVYTTSGIFGTPLSVSATYVFIFILFGAILEATGAGKMFIDLALRAFGKYKGGPAKAAVVSSGMLGSISGSSVANAVTTGTFTIPLMKKVGFRPQVAGGIEVASSSSGQLLPPIMGAAAFLMIEYTPYNYGQIIVSAAIPAILSYVAILWMVHLEASKHNIQGLSKDMLVSARKTLIQQGYLILPVLTLLYFLLSGSTVSNAAFFAIVGLLGLAVFTHRIREHKGYGMLIAALVVGAAFLVGHLFNWRPEIPIVLALSVLVGILVIVLQQSFKVESAPVRFGWKELFSGFELAARNALTVIVACATAGILIGVINLTGLSSQIPVIIVNAAGDYVFIALIFTMFACLLLGLGLPTTATYVVLAAMVAPALVDLGIPIMAAHLFVLYYGILADDTPPINLPAYAVSGIANSEPVTTGIQGFKFDSGALLLPFVFATNTVILLLPENEGMYSWWFIALNIGTALAGIIAFVIFIQNQLFTKLHIFERLWALMTSFVLIYTTTFTDLLGIGMLVALFIFQYFRKPNQQLREPQTN